MRVIKAEGLPKADWIGSSDPYVSLKPGKAKTSYIKDNLNPQWNQVLVLKVQDPHRETVVFEVWDHDTAVSDDPLGFAALDLGAVSTQERELWLDLSPAGSGRLNVAVKSNKDGPYVGEKSRPKTAPPMTAPEGYYLSGTDIVRQKKPLQNLRIALHELYDD